MRLSIILFSLITPLNCLAQTYEIPGANEQPSFIFPIWFEDDNGSIDTIWLGYDPSSGLSEQYDFQFNEWQFIDTSKFTVEIWPDAFSPFMTTPPDSAYKAAVMSGTIDISIGFIKGKMPIKMYWDASLFNDSNLPFAIPPDPYPIAYGQIFCGAAEAPFVNCPSAFDDQPLTMTEAVLPDILYPVTSPHLFDGTGESPFITPESALGYFSITLNATNNILTAINLIAEKEIEIKPNPTSTIITISGITRLIDIKIYSSQGQLIFNNSVDQNLEINVREWPKGIYLISINENQSTKILII